MRLIDADKLNSDVMLPSGEEDEEFEFVTMFAIEHAPTVDAVPVKHGHWIEHDVGLICSECGHYTESMYDEPFNNEFGKGWALKRPYYCGYCGCKMDEVADDES